MIFHIFNIQKHVKSSLKSFTLLSGNDWYHALPFAKAAQQSHNKAAVKHRSLEANDNTAIHQTNLRDGITFTPKNGKIQGKRPIKACWIPFISTLGLTTQPGVPCTHRPRLEDQTMVYPSRPKINMEHGRITRQQMATNRAYTVANSSKPTGPIVPSQYACSHKSHSTFTKNRKLVWEHVRYSNVFCTGRKIWHVAEVSETTLAGMDFRSTCPVLQRL